MYKLMIHPVGGGVPDAPAAEPPIRIGWQRIEMRYCRDVEDAVPYGCEIYSFST